MPFFKITHHKKYHITQSNYQLRDLSSQGKSLQQNKATSLNDIITTNQKCSTRKRVSPSISSSYRGSITVEASLVLPLFIFFLMNLCSLILFVHTYSSVDTMLYKAAKEMAILAYAYENNIDSSSIGSLVGESAMLLATEEVINQGITADGILDSRISLIGSKLFEDDEIALVATYQVKPLIGIMSYTSFTVTNHCNVRCFTGYDTTQGTDGEIGETYVYVTETGTVYHLTTSCTYLDIQTSSVPASTIEEYRNESGGIYYACELCGDNQASTYYIAQYGTSYHSTLSCSAIMRNITAIPISEVGSRHVCSKCGT